MADKVQVIIPTSINLLTAINETFVTQKKNGDVVGINLPSLRRRALLVVNEVGVLPISKFTPTTTNFTR